MCMMYISIFDYSRVFIKYLIGKKKPVESDKNVCEISADLNFSRQGKKTYNQYKS